MLFYVYKQKLIVV